MNIVNMIDAGPRKLDVLFAFRKLGLGILKGRELINLAPVVVAWDIDDDTAMKLALTLELAGAKVEIV